MIAHPLLSENSLIAQLGEKGCACTNETTGTGTIWCTREGLHFTVPFSYQGYYPDWMLRELERVVGRINSWSDLRRKL